MRVDCDIFRRKSLVHAGAGAIASIQGPTQTVTMAQINGDWVFWSQVLFSNPCDNFILQFRQSLLSGTGNSQGVEILPVAVFRQVALIKNDDFIAVRRAFLEMGR